MGRGRPRLYFVVGLGREWVFGAGEGDVESYYGLVWLHDLQSEVMGLFFMFWIVMIFVFWRENGGLGYNHREIGFVPLFLEIFYVTAR